MNPVKVLSFIKPSSSVSKKVSSAPGGDYTGAKDCLAGKIFDIRNNLLSLSSKNEIDIGDILFCCPHSSSTDIDSIRKNIRNITEISGHLLLSTSDSKLHAKTKMLSERMDKYYRYCRQIELLEHVSYVQEECSASESESINKNPANKGSLKLEPLSETTPKSKYSVINEFREKITSEEKNYISSLITLYQYKNTLPTINSLPKRLQELLPELAKIADENTLKTADLAVPTAHAMLIDSDRRPQQGDKTFYDFYSKLNRKCEPYYAFLTCLINSYRTTSQA